MHLWEPQKIQSILSQFYSISQVVYTNVRLSNTFRMPEIRRFKKLIYRLNLSIYGIYGDGPYQILKCQIEDRKQYQSLTFEQKVLVYDSLIELFPQNIKSYEDKIAFLENSQQYEQIIKGYTMVIQTYPDVQIKLKYFQKKVELYAKLKKLNQYQMQLNLAISRSPSTILHIQRGLSRFYLEKYSQAQEDFKSGRLEHFFNNQLNNFYLGKIYFIRKQFKRSLSYFQYVTDIQKAAIYKCILREYLNEDDSDPQKVYQRIFMPSKIKQMRAVDKLKLIYKEVRRFQQ